MENGTEDIEIEDNVVDVETNDVDIADTSSEEFFNEDNINNNNSPADDVPATEDGGDDPAPEGEEGDDSVSYEGNNQYKAALHDWAKENDVLDSFDFDNLDEETFSEQDMRTAVGRKQAMDHIESSDPVLHKIIQSGVNINDYVKESMQYQNMLANDDTTLFKGQMYNYLVNKNKEMGVLQVDDKGQMTQESYDVIMNEIETHTSKMTPEQFKAKGDAIRSQINEQINKIPEHLEQRYSAMQEQSVQKYEADLKTYTEEISKTINKSKNIVIGFADQSARDEFKDFFEKEAKLTEFEIGGEKTMAVPFFHKLQTDNNYLLKMMRLSHMLDSGYFTDNNNKARNDAFSQLGLRAGKKANNGKKHGSKTRNGVNYADTSSKEFFEG